MSYQIFSMIAECWARGRTLSAIISLYERVAFCICIIMISMSSRAKEKLKKMQLLPDRTAAQEAEAWNLFSIIFGINVATPDKAIPSVTMLSDMKKKQGLRSNDHVTLIKWWKEWLCLEAVKQALVSESKIFTFFLSLCASDIRFCRIFCAAVPHKSKDSS